MRADGRPPLQRAPSLTWVPRRRCSSSHAQPPGRRTRQHHQAVVAAPLPDGWPEPPHPGSLAAGQALAPATGSPVVPSQNICSQR
ncbi:hypothetical protein QYE76_029614 [Lolium multiflorum]|uniref:Uncharacterized protein n=1 Tax=Lolium multiflorum TaxID=4521 RepID=A0AAD8QN50_LOLMU|nr:hypothetical protein QYE76_029614 [Lolium multiflorum]